MEVNFKVLCRVTLVVLAIAAAAAPAAGAAPAKLTSTGPVTLAATQTGELGSNFLTDFGSYTRCPSATFTGHKYNVTPHEIIPSGESTLTITPHYGTCSAFIEIGELPATIDMNGCDYVLNIGETTEGKTDTYAATESIVCPEGKHIQITVFIGSPHSIGVCTMTITEKVGAYGGLDLVDTTNGTLDLSGTIEGLVLHRSGVGCSTKTEEKGVWHIDLSITGKNLVGVATDISLSEPEFPSTVTGTPTGAESANALTHFGTSTQCPGAVFTGHKYNVTPHEAPASGESFITVTPHYGKCTSLGFPSTVDMNGCDYVLHIGGTTAGKSDTYAASETIGCPEGKHVQITVFTGASHAIKACTITLTEKAEGYGGLDLVDTTNGTLDLSGTLEGLVLHRSGFGCSTETDEKGVWHVDLGITGKNSDGKTTGLSMSEAEESVTLTATQTGSATANSLTAFGSSSVSCPGAIFTGHKYNVTPHEALPSGESSVTITPHHGTCSAALGENSFPSTVDMNGCDYVLHIGKKTEGKADTYAATETVVCPEGKHMQITVFLGAAHATKVCTITLTEKVEGYGGLDLVDTTNGTLDLSGTLEGLVLHRSGVGCSTETDEKGVWHVDLGVGGKNSKGQASGLSITEGGAISTGPTGVYVFQ